LGGARGELSRKLEVPDNLRPRVWRQTRTLAHGADPSLVRELFGGPATLGDSHVEFGLSLTTSGGDETLRDGSHTWFYSLARQASGAWRVHGGGP
jgi:hypothetical protein